MTPLKYWGKYWGNVPHNFRVWLRKAGVVHPSFIDLQLAWQAYLNNERPGDYYRTFHYVEPLRGLNNYYGKAEGVQSSASDGTKAVHAGN